MSAGARSRDAAPRFGPGAEFELIRSFVGGGRALPPGVLVGPGDDCAVLEGGLVLGCDMTVEDVHFRRGWLDPWDIGYRAAAATLSDVAAMAADPLGVLVAYALPRDGGREMASALHDGVETASRSVGAGVVGGDVTASPGPLVVDVTAVGRADAPVRRSGVREGDELWVTGRLGAAAAAVRLLMEGTEPPETLRRAWIRPRPRIAEARWLAAHAPLEALIDLSDGLAGDAAHLAAASGVTVVVDGDAVPVAAGVADAVGGDAEALELALGGGEDYELLLAVPPGALDDAATAFRDTFGLPLTRVGTARPRDDDAPVLLQPAGGGPPAPLRSGGWDHFAEPGKGG